eukprot:CAMPEP_0113297104 /NCGR_PEP_ID=MMETSP0010_2-20120614/104_1 /TAXON_ID=216773 ORGANISM="Corethron hystrix, Strain 308" /NCGR_SAMPLE_ID=MMETSP0010_2 /ASSEMBLY_ACC=CAM_ASM_000155 /LENGTH=144 /DNA_ID=CAMNT_0000149935 /DNA_START=503 /DNA_END=937 /DNA_ORIENTATION=- /assembly_acc=CAM_ASM_000155
MAPGNTEIENQVADVVGIYNHYLQIILLVMECDQDCFRKMQARVGWGHRPDKTAEFDVPHPRFYGLLAFFFYHLDRSTGPHHKEHCTNEQVRDTLFLVVASSGNDSQVANVQQEGSLVPCRGVNVAAFLEPIAQEEIDGTVAVF